MTNLLPRAVPLGLVCAVSLIWIAASSFVADQRRSFNQLPTIFNIERSRDANEIVYKAILTENGTLDPDSPVEAFWVKHAENGVVEPISWIQRELSYGLKFKEIEEEKAVFHFAAYDKKLIHLRRDFGSFKAYTISMDRLVQIDKIYVHFDGGTDWLPTVSYVKIYSHAVATGEEITEIIYP